MRIKIISPSIIQDIVENVTSEMSEHDKDEMAIPSYLHKNPLIPWLMWKRYETISLLLNNSGNKKALEFGCGLGLFLSALSSKFNIVYAIDLFPQFAMALTKKLKLNTQFINDVNDLDNKSLDVIVAADVLEHIEELDVVLNNFHNKLNSSGQLIVSGPTESIVYKAGRILAGFGDKGDYHHTNIDNLINDITNNGFKLMSVKRLPFHFLPCLFKICLFEKT
jgi:2-polyprenyl-3-methyl-5-hydroxy-6-metoxy-1,4-benzoquinol methylase